MSAVLAVICLAAVGASCIVAAVYLAFGLPAALAAIGVGLIIAAVIVRNGIIKHGE